MGGVSGLGPFAVAGLAGVFKQRIWLPPADPVFRTRDELLRSLSHQQRWRRGRPAAAPRCDLPGRLPGARRRTGRYPCRSRSAVDTPTRFPGDRRTRAYPGGQADRIRSSPRQQCRNHSRRHPHGWTGEGRSFPAGRGRSAMSGCRLREGERVAGVAGRRRPVNPCLPCDDTGFRYSETRFFSSRNATDRQTGEKLLNGNDDVELHTALELSLIASRTPGAALVPDPSGGGMATWFPFMSRLKQLCLPGCLQPGCGLPAPFLFNRRAGAV